MRVRFHGLNVLAISFALAIVGARTSLFAQSRWSIAARHHLNWGGPRTRAGDIQGYGIAAWYDTGRRWRLSAGIDHLEYDLETPIHATTVQSAPGDKPVDSFTKVFRARVDGAWLLTRRARWTPYLSAGVAAYSIDAADVKGNTADGETFSLDIDTPTTVGISAALGIDWALHNRVGAGFALSYAQSAARYRVTDNQSGARGTIAPLAILGLTTQISFRL